MNKNALTTSKDDFGLSVSPEDLKKNREEAAGVSYGFLKLAQATSGAVTMQPPAAAIGDFTIGQDNRNLGRVAHVAPVAVSYRAQLWGKGKQQGKLLAESRIKGSQEWEGIKKAGGEYGYEFLLFHVDEKFYSVFAFGKWKHRNIGDMFALMLNRGTLTLSSRVAPGKPGFPPVANLSVEQDDSVYPTPANLVEAQTSYLEKVKQAILSEKEAALEKTAPTTKPR